MLPGAGRWVATKYQLHSIPATALPLVRGVAIAAWMKIDTGSDFGTNYIKTILGPALSLC